MGAVREGWIDGFGRGGGEKVREQHCAVNGMLLV